MLQNVTKCYKIPQNPLSRPANDDSDKTLAISLTHIEMLTKLVEHTCGTWGGGTTQNIL